MRDAEEVSERSAAANRNLFSSSRRILFTHTPFAHCNRLPSSSSLFYHCRPSVESLAVIDMASSHTLSRKTENLKFSSLLAPPLSFESVIECSWHPCMHRAAAIRLVLLLRTRQRKIE
jgi:hypothetical protein